MTKTEFLEYLKGFNKKPGEYTKEEVLSICRAHRSMLAQDKNWDTLAETLGVNKSGVALRKWMERKNRQEGTAEPSIAKTGDKSADELFEELYIEKTKVRDNWNNYRRTLRDEARIDNFKEGIVSAIKELKPLPKVKEAAPVKGKVEAILMISDLHLGTDCENSVNKYNNEIAWNRLVKLTQNTIDYCVKNNVYQLDVLNLGDCVAGLIHDTIRLDQEADVVSQVMLASEYLANVMNMLTIATPVVTYRSCVDNHSRAVADKNQHLERENFNRIIDWFIEERLKNTKIKFIHDNLDLGLGKFNLLNGKTVMFSHGHQDNLNSCVQNFIGATHEWVDYVCMAHFHNSKEKTFQGAKVFINGSIIGTDPYAYGKRLFGEPEQKLLIFDNSNILDINIRLK